MTKLHIVTESATLPSSVLEKIMRLKKALDADVCAYLIRHNRFVDRHYVKALGSLWPSYTEKEIDQGEALAKQMSKSVGETEVKVVFDKQWRSDIRQDVADNDYIVLFRQDEDCELTSTAKQLISSSNCNVVVMTEKRWNSQYRVRGAIDPLHEDDPKMLADKQVYRHLQRMVKAMNAEDWQLLHAIYVPPLAIAHKKEIGEIHRQEITQLAHKLKCPNNHVKYLEGKPEHALEYHVKKQQVDLLIVGTREHNALDKWLSGSTVEYLLESNSVDMLLARR